MIILVLALVLLISCGSSAPMVELREHILAVWDRLDYEEALETLGRSVSGGENNAVAVFGQQILGFGETE